MKKLRLYGPFILGVIILLVVSYFLPQIIFRVQDGYLLTGKNTENREYTDNETMSAEYEMDTYQRIAKLVGASPDDLTISAVNYGGKNAEEVVKMLERVFAGQWMSNINRMTLGIYSDFLQETSTVSIKECKKYVLYENSALKDILLMAWYLDIDVVEDNTNIRLLVDTETEQVYGIKILCTEEKTLQSKNDTEIVQMDSSEYMKMMEYELGNILPYGMGYFSEYYDAEMETLKDVTKAEKDKNEAWYISEKEWEGGYTISFLLPYGEISTAFDMQFSKGKGSLPDYSAGIALVCDFVPEMIQN